MRPLFSPPPSPLPPCGTLWHTPRSHLLRVVSLDPCATAVPVKGPIATQPPLPQPRRYPPSSLPTPSSLPSTAATHACPLHPPHWLPADWMDDTSFQRSSALPNSEPRPSDLQNPKYNLKGVHRAWRRADLSLGDNCTQIPVRTSRGTLLLLRHDTVHAGVAPPAPHPQPPLPSTVATLNRRYPLPPLPSTVATLNRRYPLPSRHRLATYGGGGQEGGRPLRRRHQLPPVHK